MEFFKLVCYNIKANKKSDLNGGLIYEHFTTWLWQMGFFHRLVS